MKINKVLLINAPQSGDFRKSGHGGCFPHLGILHIGSAIRRFAPQIEKVRCIDGSILSEQEIAGEIARESDGRTLVGISTLSSTHESAVRIADAAKARGAFVVMGNDHATFFCEQILKNRGAVDFIALGKSGAGTLLGIIDHLNGIKPISEVPNIGYREAGGIVLPPLDPAKSGRWSHRYHRLLAGSPMFCTCPDISLIEAPQAYTRNYNALYGKLHEKEVMAITTQFGKGCSWGGRGQGGDESHICNYCAIADLQPGSIGVASAVSWMRTLKENGYSVLYEVCDDISCLIPRMDGGKPFLEELARQKLANGLGGIELFMYCRAGTIARNGGLLDILKRLNVRVVNIGLDSGSPEMLRSMTKGHSQRLLEANERAIEKLAEAGIRIYSSFVLGAPGERAETIEETIRFAERMLRIGNVVAIDPAPLLPLPGSVAWEQLRQSYGGDFENEFERGDILDTDRIARTWVERMCDVSYEAIVRAIGSIRELGERHGAVLGGFGVKGCV